MWAPSARVGPRVDDLASAHVNHGHAARATSASVEGGVDVATVAGDHRKVAESPAEAIWSVPIRVSLRVSTKTTVAGLPRRLTTNVRSDGVSMTDSG